MTKEEKVEWDRLYDRIEECDRDIAQLKSMLADRKNKRYRAFIEDDIAHEKRIREILVKAVGEPKDRRRDGAKARACGREGRSDRMRRMRAA